ncbi:MAG TPA: hypothetical protein VFR10_11805 [bacterium]|nr:hypothetical protein [bacterium]
MILRRSIILLTAIIVVLRGTGCEELPGPEDDIASPSMTTRAITFTDWTATGYATSAAESSLEDLAATGANTVVFLVTAYQQTSRSSTLGGYFDLTPTDLSVLEARAVAGRLGLHPALKLHVDVVDGSWRGFIDPANPQLWFEAYEDFAIRWADFAETYGFTELVVGTELATLSRRTAEWRHVCESVRAVFSGKLIYAASWDEAENIEFWDALDAVGVNFYNRVANRPDCGRLELLAGWQPWLARLELLHERTGLPIVLTEVGYRSRDGAGMDPMNFESESMLDLSEQADLYWAALAATAEQSWITGLYWWNWPALEHGGEASDSFTPRGKPAAALLQDVWTANAP